MRSAWRSSQPFPPHGVACDALYMRAHTTSPMAYMRGQSCGRGKHAYVEQNGYLRCTRCGSSRTVAIYGRHHRHGGHRQGPTQRAEERRNARREPRRANGRFA